VCYNAHDSRVVLIDSTTNNRGTRCSVARGVIRQVDGRALDELQPRAKPASRTSAADVSCCVHPYPTIRSNIRLLLHFHMQHVCKAAVLRAAVLLRSAVLCRGPSCLSVAGVVAAVQHSTAGSVSLTLRTALWLGSTMMTSKYL
jgi:hypothetical protein